MSGQLQVTAYTDRTCRGEICRKRRLLSAIISRCKGKQKTVINQKLGYNFLKIKTEKYLDKIKIIYNFADAKGKWCGSSALTP